MKIWKAFGGEHSAKLKIVGEFKTIENANEAARLFNDLVDVEEKNKGKNPFFSNEVMKILEEYESPLLSESDPEQMDYFDHVSPEGNKIIITTDELEIQAIIKIFFNYGAKIEIISRHYHPDEYQKL